jgi:ring-1,2-phenylacetyl-CoA epoxidase subunit PaaB
MQDSLDPRVARLGLSGESGPLEAQPLDQWQNYEVFQQRRRGEQHVHVGALHAPNAEMALLLAKEQFGRREQCASLWVVRSADVHASAYEDADMFQHAFDKSYREGSGYRVKDTIETFKLQLDSLLGHPETPERPPEPAAQPLPPAAGAWKVYRLPDTGQGPRKVFVRR